MQIGFYIFSIIVIIGTLLPLNSSKHWFIRDQTYFKVYYFLFNGILLLIYSLLFKLTWLVSILIFSHWGCAILSFRVIKSYFQFSPTKVSDVTNKAEVTALKILVFNVLYDNNDYQSFINLVNKDQPDAILLLETGQAWDDNLKPLYQNYNHIVKKIQEDTYGIIFMSKIPFLESCVNHFVVNTTPSIEALIKIKDRYIRIYGIHPEPPIPGERLTTMPKDLELILTARRILSHDEKELSILVGDLNDVGWSAISKKFRKITGMKDPREGRGFYASFPTYLPIRIPIDHIFCSPGFELISLERHPNIGSDHYPMSVTFAVI